MNRKDLKILVEREMDYWSVPGLALAALPPQGPAELMCFGKMMYAMAGYAAEQAAGDTWESLMRQRIFRPLGMERSNCRYESLAEDANHAEPCLN